MAKQKVCKHCKSEIDKGAKVCPNCQKKQSGTGKFIIIGAVVLVIIGAAVSGGKDNKPKEVAKTADKNSETPAESTETPTPEAEKTEFGVGEIVELKDVESILVSVTESEGTEFTKPAEGKIFLLCEFEISNNSDKEIVVSSMISFDAYIDDYSITQSYIDASDKGQLDGTVASGKKMNGVISYEVPADWKALEIKYTPDFWSGKDITFIANK